MKDMQLLLDSIWNAAYILTLGRILHIHKTDFLRPGYIAIYHVTIVYS